MEIHQIQIQVGDKMEESEDIQLQALLEIGGNYLSIQGIYLVVINNT